MLLTKQAKFISAIALQVVIIFVIIIFKVSVLSGGTDIMLRIEPVDPRDMLRGDYVTFRYSDVSTINQYVSGAQQVKNNSVVYVVLQKSGKYWVVQSVQTTKPTNGEVVLKGKVVRGGMENQSDMASNPYFGNFGTGADSAIEIVYGIEEYFIPEGTGQGFSFFNKEVVAKVAVDERGNAVLKQIYVNGKTFEEASLASEKEETAEPIMGTQNGQVMTQADALAVVPTETVTSTPAQTVPVVSADSVELAKISIAEQTINIDSPLDEPVDVNMYVVRALKLTSGGDGNVVSLQSCSVAGCLPGHDVAVGIGESIVKIDAMFSNSRTGTDNPGANNAYFKSQEVRFSVGNNFFPVLELRQGPTGNWVEQEPSFYIEPFKVHQQTFFIRVPKATESVKLVYGKNLSQPAFTFQACFSDSCYSGFLPGF